MYLFIAVLLIFSPFIATASDLELLPALDESSFGSVPLGDLGKDVRRGVEAQALLESQPLLDISEPLEGDLQHYLITIVFTDLGIGKALLEGQVAARVSNAEQRMTDTVRLEPQQNQWRGILRLPAEGETMIKVGTKLSDGKKRIYRFFHNRQTVMILPEEQAPSE